jgi:hypothetical protein
MCVCAIIRAHLKGEAVRVALEGNDNRTKYVRVVRNLLNFKLGLNVDGHYAVKVMMFKYLCSLIRGEQKLVWKSK